MTHSRKRKVIGKWSSPCSAPSPQPRKHSQNLDHYLDVGVFRHDAVQSLLPDPLSYLFLLNPPPPPSLVFFSMFLVFLFWKETVMSSLELLLVACDFSTYCSGLPVSNFPQKPKQTWSRPAQSGDPGNTEQSWKQNAFHQGPSVCFQLPQMSPPHLLPLLSYLNALAVEAVIYWGKCPRRTKPSRSRLESSMTCSPRKVSPILPSLGTVFSDHTFPSAPHLLLL